MVKIALGVFIGLCIFYALYLISTAIVEWSYDSLTKHELEKIRKDTDALVEKKDEKQD